MKKNAGLCAWCLTVLIIVCVPFSEFASGEKELKYEGEDQSKEQGLEEKKEKTKKPASGMLLNYKPPLRGKPGSRVGGGSRGAGQDDLFLAFLAPDHTGLTTKRQPSLYWFVSRPTATRIEITINDEKSIQPVLEITLEKPEEVGIQSFRLADHDLALLPGVEYQWFVSIIPDPEYRSKDIVDTGYIKLIEPSKTLNEKLANASGLEVSVIYAEEGLWYDALGAISELIEIDPKNSELREQRAYLLEQIGLNTVADYERKLK
jgi:hypothetical protein